jgi:hypothetical protein
MHLLLYFYLLVHCEYALSILIVCNYLLSYIYIYIYIQLYIYIYIQMPSLSFLITSPSPLSVFYSSWILIMYATSHSPYSSYIYMYNSLALATAISRSIDFFIDPVVGWFSDNHSYRCKLLLYFYVSLLPILLYFEFSRSFNLIQSLITLYIPLFQSVLPQRT